MRFFIFICLALCVYLPAAPGQTKPDESPAAQVPKPSEASNPPPLKTTVVVNATLASEVPASISVLTQQQLQQIHGIQLDDRLRQIPGFSLFRRSSSLVANPTTQGVSLRATGSTGASRTLVLWDGIPINDPFGGWVYWDRVDPDYIGEVDIDRGASTSVFGNLAMGGSISLFTPSEERRHLFADALGGNNGTADVSAAYSDTWGKWGLSLHSRALTTDGFYIVPDTIRGQVDDKANARFVTGDFRLDYLAAKDRLSFWSNILAEERQNGTLLTHNSTGLGTLGVHYTHSATKDQLSFLGFHTEEQFHSTFSSVSASRNFERLTSKQTVPVNDFGGAAYWQHHEKRWNTIGGADVDRTHGFSYDYSYTTHVLTPGGGTLVQRGVFGQTDLTLGPVRFFAGVREQFTGQHGEKFFSPNGGAVVGWKGLRFRTAGYRSFRAPTLNELYRNFRVGNALTLANSNLVPEGLVGVEAGVDWTHENSRVGFTVFRNELNNLIDNATLSTSSTLILRQRRNFPSALSRGAEANANYRWTHWRAEAAYMFADSRLATGQRIPEVPKQQGTAQLVFNARSTLISGGIRAFGLVFDDDLNQYRLPGFASLGLTAQQYVTKKFSVVASVDNLLDRSYLVALTPNPNTGSPRLWLAGLRWNGSFK